MPCHLSDRGPRGCSTPSTVVKNDSMTSVKAPKKVKKGKVAKVVTTVAGGVTAFKGKVVIKDG